jgi:hypothetical protein
VVRNFTFSLLHPSHMISQILQMSLWLLIDGLFMLSCLVPICFEDLQGLSVYWWATMVTFSLLRFFAEPSALTWIFFWDITWPYKSHILPTWMWAFLLLGYEWDNVCEMGETADRCWERLQLDALTMELLMWDNESNNKKAHSWDQWMLSKWGWNCWCETMSLTTKRHIPETNWCQSGDGMWTWEEHISKINFVF